MRRILSVADSIENTRYSVQRCVNTYNDYNVESMIAVPQFTGEDADEQTDIGEVLDYCFSQEKFDAIFIGMIRDAGAVNTVSNSLLKYDHPAVVAELSIISPEGKILISRETYDAIVGSLMQNVHFLTINLYEAELLSGIECHGPADARQAAETICEKFHSVVFIEGCKKTGGRDLFVLGGKAKWFDGTATHSPTRRISPLQSLANLRAESRSRMPLRRQDSIAGSLPELKTRPITPSSMFRQVPKLPSRFVFLLLKHLSRSALLSLPKSPRQYRHLLNPRLFRPSLHRRLKLLKNPNHPLSLRSARSFHLPRASVTLLEILSRSRAASSLRAVSAFPATVSLPGNLQNRASLPL